MVAISGLAFEITIRTELVRGDVTLPSADPIIASSPLDMASH